MLNITFSDFDTACYNLQHNVIELIKHCVGISVQVDLNTGKIDEVDQKVTGLYQIQLNMQATLEDMVKTMGLLNEALSKTNGQLTILQADIDDLWNQYSATKIKVGNLEARVEALEGKVG